MKKFEREIYKLAAKMVEELVMKGGMKKEKAMGIAKAWAEQTIVLVKANFEEME